jgi:hypothetical protein
MNVRSLDIDGGQMDIIKRAKIKLESDAILPSGMRIVLTAGNEVLLLRNFEVSNTAALEVRIEDCPNSNN